ncbi:isoaspartyl peptidase/L-asparaginase family protein [Salegentibacter mishustinae]|uniref:Isoaspartyl peptidase n=1 Tax=Salegentibacter mishustinae TaxID=270918 RepID=A0A0Q9ZAD7_9FLAO|nr:isoaspartyl peptidase/L-asparaginase [Salegentibacter mishustinae]KRG29967.1 isoaspartyl peptidase [Salegentibacter mishustinae]PNW20626.1 isoaspartyl peptidase [Salegentibacter mishustinae]PZX61636.1 beta-aspartyl-peptidase (threonine type) [Salegentibacter mishustinae]GGW98657.1 isoaspartyl peptidase/L-asparaginase [Salegentibacter mishustinae]
MKKIFLLFSLSIFLACNTSAEKETQTNQIAETEKAQDSVENFGIVIHGGAGTILKENMSDSLEQAYKAKLEEAIRTGHEILANGGTAIEAVQRTINIMENSPLFNAGKGAVFTNEGKNELDASIMEGKTLNAGAVSGVTTIKNPINLAWEVMENSEHVMLSGKGAEQFAKERNLEIVNPEYFYTENRFKSLERLKERNSEKTELDHDGKTAFVDPFIKDSKFGTVGCAALDKNGNLAAGTSTGGMTNKKWGRIGDAPIIGAGTYANNKTAAISATGWGEFFIRGVVAYDISALMEYKEMSLAEAAKEVIQNKNPELGGSGGIIAIDHQGNVSMEFNTAGMYRAKMNQDGDLEIGIYSE